ncbi:Eaa1 [Raoultella ornithinolytica]|nr:Eaa1 [Raoultella ornithinolytica]
MTSKLTRLTDDELTETLRQATSGYPLPASVEGNLRHAFAELQERRKAAMDSEPVAHVDPQSFDNFKSNDGKNAACTKEWMWRDPSDDLIPLYRHAQPAPVEVTDDELNEALRLHRLNVDGHSQLSDSFRAGFKYARRTNSQPAPDREQVRREHAEWSQATFGDVGPIGPLKHLSKEALEAAADPHDPLEWADMQFLLWDAQRRMGISDEFITRAMIEKLAINKARLWPEPKDGEPRLHIKEQSAPVIPSELHPDTKKLVTEFCTAIAEKLYKAQLKYGYDADWKQDGWPSQCQAQFHQHIAKGDPRDVAAYCAFMWYHGWKTEAAQQVPVVPDERDKTVDADDHPLLWSFNEGWSACRAAMLQAGTLTNEGETILHNYRTAMEGIGHIRRTLEETFGGLHGTHVEPDVLMDCKTICDAIYAAYSGNSPVIPDGYVMVPVDLLSELRDWAHPEIEKYCEMWKGRRDSEFPALRKVIADADALLAAAPQEAKGE